MQRLFVNDVT